MSSIHGHEVLQMMLASGESWTVASLEAAIRRRFGEEARFHTCSAGSVFREKRQIYCQRGRIYYRRK